MVVSRRLVALLAVLIPLAIPGAGGGSGTPGRADRDGPRATRREPAAPPSTLIGDAESDGDAAMPPPPAFPLFLRAPASAPVEIGGAAPMIPAGRDREILLTFDDGPDLESTPMVLAELDRRGHKAIFFVNGRNLMGDRPADRARREILRRVARHGHLIGNHTVNHVNLCADKTVMDREIDGNNELITAVTGVRPVLFRSPYGARCRALTAALAARGMINVGWNVDAQEWKAATEHTGATDGIIAARIINQLSGLPGRGAILLHDTNPLAVRALPRILDHLATQAAAPGAGARLTLVDYRVYLQQKKLPRLGIDAALLDVAQALAAVPGVTTLRARVGL